MVAHLTFSSTGRAYDATQTDETIKNGRALYIPSESVVGLAYTWPIAVTVETGELHSMTEGHTADSEALADWRITVEQVQAAVALAQSFGLEIAPAFAAYKESGL